jgi:NitT/TauT family transport system ATP-binding protein
MIQLHGISKTFESTNLQVLKDINLEIKAGEFVSIIGPSGCGKTTLLNIIGGLEKLSSGLLRFGKDSPSFGFVFQKPALFNWKNVEQNIELPYEILGVKTRTTEQLLQMFGLGQFRKYRPLELSGGMQQKVSLARALSFEPDVLLMDEPFSSIDELSRERLEIELQELWIKTEKTVLFVTHSIDEAIFLSDRVIVLSERPATVKKIVNVQLPRPRNLSMMHTASFQGYVKWIKETLRT